MDNVSGFEIFCFQVDDVPQFSNAQVKKLYCYLTNNECQRLRLRVSGRLAEASLLQQLWSFPVTPRDQLFGDLTKTSRGYSIPLS
jgi:hypothetical protein